VLDGVPVALPALQRAQRLQQKAGTTGFEWEKIEQVISKFHSELEELEQARAAGDAKQIEDEFGDVLFALVNVGRWLDLNPEDALRQACEKFSRRFRFVEAKSAAENLEAMTLEKWETLWNAAKENA
jgi:uncharacterized protein YabN with tetrapyrrole methylase and pyrophosphatase domain